MNCRIMRIPQRIALPVILLANTLWFPAFAANRSQPTACDSRDYLLEVVSAHGDPAPPVGTHAYPWRSTVAASVPNPADTGGVLYDCTGWTGTGSAPAAGIAASTGAFVLDQLASSVTWHWRERAPATNRSQPVACDSRDYLLEVVSAHGDPAPPVGSHAYPWRSTVVASVPNPADAAGVLYDCSGWTGTGSAPAAGVAASTGAFVLDQLASSVTWQWQERGPATNRSQPTACDSRDYLLEVVSAHGDPAPPVGTQAYPWRSTVSASVPTPADTGGVLYDCSGWTGTGSAPAAGIAANTGAFVLDQLASSVVWHWRERGPATNRSQPVACDSRDYLLEVVSAHGAPAPPVGNQAYPWRSTVSASVPTPADTGGVLYDCTGWTGTGSVPITGATAITEPFVLESLVSSITWHWGPASSDWAWTIVGDGTLGTAVFGQALHASAAIDPADPDITYSAPGGLPGLWFRLEQTRLQQDTRGLDTPAEWHLVVEPLGQERLLSWTAPADFPEHLFASLYEVTADHQPTGSPALDMAQTTTLRVPPGERRHYAIRVAPTLLQVLALVRGWNFPALVGDPVLADVADIFAIAPDGRRSRPVFTGAAWRWGGRGYVPTTALAALAPVWILCLEPATILVELQGWAPLPTSRRIGWEAVAVPTGATLSEFGSTAEYCWEWNADGQFYLLATFLQPGRGYFLDL